MENRSLVITKYKLSPVLNKWLGKNPREPCKISISISGFQAATGDPLVQGGGKMAWLEQVLEMRVHDKKLHPGRNQFLLVVFAFSNWDFSFFFFFYSFLLAKWSRHISYLTCKERGWLPLKLQSRCWYPRNKSTPKLGKPSEF